MRKILFGLLVAVAILWLLWEWIKPKSNFVPTAGSLDLATLTASTTTEVPKVVRYNSPRNYVITAAYTFAANTIHQFEYVIVGGTANIRFDTEPAVTYPANTSDEIKADTLISKAIVITPNAGATVYVTTLS